MNEFYNSIIERPTIIKVPESEVYFDYRFDMNRDIHYFKYFFIENDKKYGFSFRITDEYLQGLRGPLLSWDIHKTCLAVLVNEMLIPLKREGHLSFGYQIPEGGEYPNIDTDNEVFQRHIVMEENENDEKGS
jgi:hypothetical protein